MKVCPYCRHDLPNDSTFCIHCGKPLEAKKEETQKKATKRQRANIEKEKVVLEKAKRNIWTPLGVILFLVGLIVLDGILATIFNAFKMDYKIIFILSSFVYLGAIVCGVMSILEDRKAHKENKQPTGNSMLAYAEIVISFYILLVNVQQILLK